MEGKDSHDLDTLQKKALEELSKLPEEEKAVIQSSLELQEQRNILHRAFLSELRTLENAYEQRYLPLYTQRSEIVKKTQDFWLKVLKNNPLTSTMICEQDEPLLVHLTDIKCISEETSDNFTLEFHFSDNKMISNDVLTQKYFIGSNGHPEKSEGSEIKWKGTTNLTQVIKKKKTKGKNKKIIRKVEEIPSFFRLFKNLSAVDEDNDNEGEDEEDKDDLGDNIEENYDIGCEFRDEIVPNAFFYYLGIRNLEEGEDDDDDEELGGKPRAKKIDGSGGEKADCKPQ